MKIKTLSLAALLLAATLSAAAQSPSESATPAPDYVMPPHALSLDLGGGFSFAGIAWDARFKEGSPWGYRAGLGFGYTQSTNFFGTNNSIRFYNLPLAVNYLMGKRRSKFELGAGLNFSLCNSHVGYYKFQIDQEQQIIGLVKNGEEKRNQVMADLTLTIGYRHISKKGFLFRAGVTPMLQLTDKWVNADYVEYKRGTIFIAPYLSFGWAF